VNISARKITSRFERIEKVELQEESGEDLPVFRKQTLIEQGEE
jgi:hypothetical protein